MCWQALTGSVSKAQVGQAVITACWVSIFCLQPSQRGSEHFRDTHISLWQQRYNTKQCAWDCVVLKAKGSHKGHCNILCMFLCNHVTEGCMITWFSASFYFYFKGSPSLLLRPSQSGSLSPEPLPVESRIKQDKSDFEEQQRRRVAQEARAERRQKKQVRSVEKKNY